MPHASVYSPTVLFTQTSNTQHNEASLQLDQLLVHERVQVDLRCAGPFRRFIT